MTNKTDDMPQEIWIDPPSDGCGTYLTQKPRLAYKYTRSVEITDERVISALEDLEDHEDRGLIMFSVDWVKVVKAVLSDYGQMVECIRDLEESLLLLSGRVRDKGIENSELHTTGKLRQISEIGFHALERNSFIIKKCRGKK